MMEEIMKLDSMQLDDLQTLAQSTLTKLKENLESSKQSSMSITEDLKRLNDLVSKLNQLRTDLERSKKWNKRFSIIMVIEAVIIALLILLWRVL